MAFPWEEAKKYQQQKMIPALPQPPRVEDIPEQGC